MSIRRALWRGVNVLLRPFGVRLARRYAQPMPTTLYLARKALQGNACPFVIDIGAARGDFAADILEHWPQASVVCIEPMPAHRAGLLARFEGGPVLVASVAAGDSEGTVLFREAASGFSSSVLPMGRHADEFPLASVEVDSYAVPVTRLDTLLAAHAMTGCIDLLKVDVQGYELPVLRGAEEALARCAAAIVEVSLCPLYEGQESLDALFVHMRDHGFRLADHAEGARSHVNGRLLQLDCLFLRAEGSG